MNILKNKKAVIFDFDGTLADTLDMWDKVDELLILSIASESVKTKLLENDSWKKDISQFRTDSLRRNKDKDIYLEYCNDLAKKYDSKLDRNEVNSKRNEIAQYFMKNCIYLKEGAAEFIQYLKSNGYYLILATVGSNWSLDIYAKYNKNINSVLDIYNDFDLVLTKDQVNKKKPDPQVYLKAVELSGFKNSECLVFEDSLEGSEAAYNANVDVVNIYDKHSDHEREEINLLVKKSFTDFNEILHTKRKVIK